MEPEQEQSIVSEHYPLELKQLVLWYQLHDIANQITNFRQARDYVISFSLINKQCNEWVNDPIIFKKIIHGISEGLLKKNETWFESSIASSFVIQAAREYRDLNDQFFSKNATPESIKELLALGADPNYRRNTIQRYTYDKETCPYEREHHTYACAPLIFFAAGKTENDLAIIRLLLENGASVDVRFRDYTPLSVAICQHKQDIITLLLSYNPKDTCLESAVQYGNNTAFDVIEKSDNVNYTKALFQAIRKKDIHLISHLLENGACPDEYIDNVFHTTLVGDIETVDIFTLLCKYVQNTQIRDRVYMQATQTQNRLTGMVYALVHGDQDEDDMPELVELDDQAAEDEWHQYYYQAPAVYYDEQREDQDSETDDDPEQNHGWEDGHLMK